MKEKKEKPVFFDEIPTKGRPKKIINENGKKLIEQLAGMMCTDEEIASVMNVTCDTLTNKNNGQTFSDCKKRGMDTGKASLRRYQWDSAKRGNVTMQIWLGKQYLGQAEKQESEPMGDRGINITITPATPIDDGEDEE